MKLFDVIILSAAAYATYNIYNNRKSTKNQNQTLNGDALPDNSGKMYDLDDCIFRYSEDATQSVMLQCFSADYTSPRMLSDDKLYNAAVAASNTSGAPCGWVQVVAFNNPNSNLSNSARIMIIFCDDFIKKSGNIINLKKMRDDAILSGINA